VLQRQALAGKTNWRRPRHTWDCPPLRLARQTSDKYDRIEVWVGIRSAVEEEPIRHRDSRRVLQPL
jgi:hypothetical protein